MQIKKSGLNLLLSFAIALTPFAACLAAPQDDDPVEMTYAQVQAVKEEQIRLREMEGMQHWEQAQFYAGQWDLKMASLELECAIMYAPDLKVAHRDFCLVSIAQGQLPRALAEFMMVVGLGDAVPLDPAEQAGLKQRACTLHYNKGLEWGKKNHWESAVSELQWSLTYAPNSASVERSLAFAYASSGKFDLAEKEYAKSFAIDPNDAFAHADLGFVLNASGQKDKAIEQLSEAVKLNPQVAALHMDLGWMAESKGDFAEAENELRAAIKLSPTHAGLWLHLGRILEQEKKTQDAIQAYKKVLAIDPTEDQASSRLKALDTAKPSDDAAPGKRPEIKS